MVGGSDLGILLELFGDVWLGALIWEFFWNSLGILLEFEIAYFHNVVNLT